MSWKRLKISILMSKCPKRTNEMNFCIKREFLDDNKDKARIPRPPNAFMLYANENRKKMSQMYPTESNKDISKRLGQGWKTLDGDERKRFFDKARVIGLQHKKEYPDYVYNPKEARIRKAMRDATRERSSIVGGTSPMLQRPAARRGGWVAHSQSPHDDLMMSPMAGIQAPSVCGFPSNEQFIGAMNAYNKLEAAAPPPMPPSTTSMHTNYMQTNPLAQLQQHAEMWPEYQATMRPRSSGNPFLMADVPAYHGQSPELTTPLMMEKEPPPPNTPPTDDTEPEKERTEEHNFIPVYEQNEESKMKKPPCDTLFLPSSSQALRASLFTNDLKYQKNYIVDYFQNSPAMTLMNVTTSNGTTFPYATYSPTNLPDHVKKETEVFENVSEPIFFHTDVGFVPMSMTM